ncbi:MAG: hypothetical protein R3Y28_05570 [Candidatus Gastranaerophilales bacterium]
MQKISTTITITLISIVMWFTLLNTSNQIDLNLINQTIANLIGCDVVSERINLGLLIFFIFTLGLLSAIVFFVPMMKVTNDKNAAIERELEKKSISDKESSSRVKVLESKIKVLEKALDNALKK